MGAAGPALRGIASKPASALRLFTVFSIRFQSRALILACWQSLRRDEWISVSFQEWQKLSAPVRSQFKKKLRERLKTPHVPADRLRGYRDVYKIKLRAAGYRLVYEVQDEVLVVYVLAVARRDKNRVYKKLSQRS